MAYFKRAEFWHRTGSEAELHRGKFGRGDPRLFERGDTNAPWRVTLRPAIRVPPYVAGKHHPETGCHAPGRRPGSRPGERWTSRRPGPHLDQNVLGQLRRGSLGLDSGLSGGLFSARRTALSAARHPIWRKRGTRKSGLETNAENEARSALLARLWCPPIPAKPRQPRGKSHPSLQCRNWADWVAVGAVWSYPVSAGNHE